MGYELVSGGDGSEERERWAFTFSVVGDLRFISHRDTMRLFQRAFARASLPVRFSEGFNPHARLSIPLPRPVGVASQAETVVVEFHKAIDGEDAVRLLNERLPSAIHVNGSRRLGSGERLEPALVRYRLARDGPCEPELLSRVQQILGASVLQVQRVNPKQKEPRAIDVRPYISTIHAEDDAIEFTLRVTQHGSARPAEIVELLGFDAGSVIHRVRRMEVQWHSNSQ